MTYEHTNGRPLRLDLVVRTSKRKAGAQSPKQQRDIAQACADTYGHEIVRVHDSGRSESGKTMARSTVHAAMERVRLRETDGIIVALTDRLGRAPIEEAMTLIRELDGIGYLVLADAGGQPVNLSDPQAETNLVLQLQMARQYWTQTAARAARTKADAIAAGKYVAPAPPGYGKDSDKRLVQNEDAGFMRRVFRAAGSGSLRPAQALLRERWPNGRWDTDRVRKLLASPAYKGWSVSGELENREAHKAIVSVAEWDAAQHGARQRRTNGDYPLSGIAQTPGGAPLVGHLQTVKDRQYRRMRAPGCSISATALENHVLGVLTAALDDADFRKQYVPGDIEAATHALAQARDEVAAYLANPTVAALDAELFATGLDARQARVTAAQAAFDEIASASAAYESLPSAARLAFDRDELGHPLNADAFETALAVTVERVVVTSDRGPVSDRVEIVWR